eukprot:5148325-Amphidinium_carterae.1
MKAIGRDRSNATTVLKMTSESSRVMVLFGGLLTPIMGAHDVLTGRMSSKNSMIGIAPEVTLKVTGVSNKWSLCNFRFRSESEGVKDALLAESFIGLVCGANGKSIQAREKILQKSLVIQREVAKRPYSFGLGASSQQDWVHLVQLAPDMWLNTPETRQFIEAATGLMSDETSYATWERFAANIRETCQKIQRLSMKPEDSLKKPDEGSQG